MLDFNFTPLLCLLLATVVCFPFCHLTQQLVSFFGDFFVSFMSYFVYNLADVHFKKTLQKNLMA